MSNARRTSRTTQVAIRLSNAELERVLVVCAALRLSLADAVRQAVAAWPQARADAGREGE